MKKLFTCLTLALLSFFAQAGHNDGKITITRLGAQKIYIQIDGKNYNDDDQFLLMNSVVPGNHSILIYKKAQKTKNSNKYLPNTQVIYSAKVLLRQGHHIDIVINRFGKVLIDDQVMDALYDQEHCDDDAIENSRNDRRDYNQHTNDPRNNPYDNRNDNQYKDNRYSMRPMADQPFAAYSETLKKESFENTRLNLARQVSDQNYFTTVQVKQIIQLFTFENSRLDLAKYLYRNTVDKENYFQLYDVFSYSQSKDALAAYIRDYK